jgi:predicted transcriptional regulator
MKTMAIRLDDELHAQLTVLAQLEESSVTDVIRQAIETHLEKKRTQPELSTKAAEVLAAIDAQADRQRDAIASMFGNTEQPAKTTRARKSSDS